MAHVSLQIKNVASILLAAAASACSGLTVKMCLDRKSWAVPAVCLAVALSCQLGLIFVESKEEEELSLLRKERLAEIRRSLKRTRRSALAYVRRSGLAVLKLLPIGKSSGESAMANKIYVADHFRDSLKDVPPSEQQKIFDYVETLAGDGWKDSHIVRTDDSKGGGLRASLTGDMRVLFSYAPEDHLIIVTGVMPSCDYELATKA